MKSSLCCLHVHTYIRTYTHTRIHSHTHTHTHNGRPANCITKDGCAYDNTPRPVYVRLLRKHGRPGATAGVTGGGTRRRLGARGAGVAGSGPIYTRGPWVRAGRDVRELPEPGPGCTGRPACAGSGPSRAGVRGSSPYMYLYLGAGMYLCTDIYLYKILLV